MYVRVFVLCVYSLSFLPFRKPLAPVVDQLNGDIDFYHNCVCHLQYNLFA